MRAFEILKYGGIDWCIWGKSDDNVYLCSSRSVYQQNQNKNDEYRVHVKQVEKDIEKYLNTKYIHKLCSNGAEYSAFYGPLKIMDLDTFKSMSRMGFALPAIKENRFLLVVKDKDKRNEAVSSFMMQADNNGNIYRECEILNPGIRAMAILKRSALDSDTNMTITNAQVAYDKTNTKHGGNLSAKRLDVTYRRSHSKLKTSECDKLFKLRYHIVFCPDNSTKNPSLLNEIKDASTEPQKLCTLKNCIVEMCAVQRDYCYALINASPLVTVDEIVNNVKSNLVPQSLREDLTFVQKILKVVPNYWSKGYLVSCEEIPMQTIEEYAEMIIGGDMA